ncbi:MAG: ribosomal-processing cysteine protease Prp [Peptostreptococcaceae bacterium]|nr:ribosomal-processing cysteine protease Prp [Peptostreptococcaceae bacterium]
MITVTTTADSDGSIYKVEVAGHAEQDEYGKDIVCAAVSALTIATINGLTEVVKADVEYLVEDGYTKFEVRDQEKTNSIKVLLDTFELAIRQMVQDHGQYVRLVKKEVQPNDQDESTAFCE